MAKDKLSGTATQVQQAPAVPSLDEAFADVQMSVERFCILAGIEVLQDMMEQDARRACGGQRYARSADRQAYRAQRVHTPRARRAPGRSTSLRDRRAR